MSKVILGAPGMIEQGQRVTHEQGRGYTGARRWIGPKENAWGLCQQLIAAGYNVVKTDDGPNAIVEASIGLIDEGAAATEQPIPLWERQINTVEKTIYEHPKLVEVLSSHNIGKQKEQIDGKEFEDFEYDSPEQAAIAEPWFKLIQAGVESFKVFQPVVRLTQTVSSRHSRVIAAASLNVGSVLTFAQMSSIEGAPAYVLDNKVPPTNLSFSIVYGYFKSDPTITQQSRDKWQIVSEWEAGFWPVISNTFV